jgi:hypothetical protein
VHTRYSRPRDQDSSVLPRISTLIATEGSFYNPNIGIDVKNQVRNLLNGTVTEISAAILCAKSASQPPQGLKVSLCASARTGAISTTLSLPELFTRVRNWLSSRTRRPDSSDRGPFVAPSRLASMNSKSKIAGRRTCGCADIGHATKVQKPKIPMNMRDIRILYGRRLQVQTAA